MGRQPIDPCAVEGDRSRAGREQAKDDLHRRRFTAGVAAEQRDDLALADLERKVEVDLNGAVERVDAIEAE
jgi:hypothetical protein